MEVLADSGVNLMLLWVHDTQPQVANVSENRYTMQGRISDCAMDYLQARSVQLVSHD